MKLKIKEGHLLLWKGDLGNLNLDYLCAPCQQAAQVDPTFFETSGGVPICPDCGEDMVVHSASLKLELT